MKNKAPLCLALLLTVALSACGGGGSSSDSFVGAADVSISAQPSEIDSGDRTEVSIEVSNVHESGIALKIRFPQGLSYVPTTALLLVDQDEIDLTPTVNAMSSDEERYLVFYIPQDAFTPGSEDYSGQAATVVLQLEGTAKVNDGLIEVDPDVDDPQQSNDTEFSIDNPEFVAEAETSITVIAE